MDEFSYTNIFDTKGIEYIIVICFFLLLVPFWVLLNKPFKLKRVLRILTASLLKIPQGIFFSKNHTWTHLEKSGYAKIGINDLLLHITGEIKLDYLKNPGEIVKKGDYIADLKQNGKQLQIASPISGKIHSMNTSRNHNSDIISEDPYGKEWIYKIKPEKWIAETQTYLLADEATKWTNQELLRFKDFIAMSSKKLSFDPAVVVLQEGGELTDNPLSELPADVWKDFQVQFLDQKG